MFFFFCFILPEIVIVLGNDRSFYEQFHHALSPQMVSMTREEVGTPVRVLLK